LGLVAGKTYAGRVWLSRSQVGTVQVSLVWGDAAGDRKTIAIENVGSTFAKTRLEFTAAKCTTNGRLEIRATGEGTLTVGPVSLMPADNVRGMRADTLALLKDLDAPVYRWPGGNFVSGYHWRDGLGDPDRRPPRKNPAWKGIEPNDFGIDEYMTFCRELDTAPYITVNSGLGVVQTAVDEVQYANAPATSPMGRLRAENGHAAPYRVRFWAIGNEMYGKWQLGHIPLEKYVQKHNAFAAAMRAADPSITLVAVGDVGPWSEGMLEHCAGHMDLMSEHFYCPSKPDLAAHVRQIPDQVRRKVAAHREYRKRFDALQGKDIRIALDEWNYWYGPEVFGEIGTRYFLKDALGIAAGLNEMARNSDMIFMANYAQTVNVIGCIKTNKTAASFETTGLVLKLYRQHFGVLPVATHSGPLDSMAAFSQDRKTLTVAVVNPSLKAVEIELAVKGASLLGKATRWQIAGNDPMAFNDPGKPAAIDIDVAVIQEAAGKLSVAPCSVTLFALPVK
jgi:alpha-N-arabinofuranosidase